MRLSRRDLLGFAARAAVLATTAPLSFTRAAVDVTLGPSVPETFGAFIDTLLPGGEGCPGAVALGVHQAILARVAGNAEATGVVRRIAAWIDERAREDAGHAFAQLDAAGRMEVVEAMAGQPQDSEPYLLFRLTLEVAYLHYYAHPDSGAALVASGHNTCQAKKLAIAASCSEPQCSGRRCFPGVISPFGCGVNTLVHMCGPYTGG